MKPVFYHQTRFGGEDAPPEERGNCWSTAIACMMGWPPSKRNELDNLIVQADIEDVGGWFNVTVGFILVDSLGKLGFYFEDVENSPLVLPENMYGDFYIAGGDSPRGNFGHAVLYHKMGTMAWDPHPSGDGLRGPIQDINYLVKLT